MTSLVWPNFFDYPDTAPNAAPPAVVLPATILKGVGLELGAVGRAEPLPGEQVIVTEDASQPSYRRLVLADDQVVGAVVLGHHPQDLPVATAAVKKQLILNDEAHAAVQAGDWSVLTGRSQPSGAMAAAAGVPA
jgi:NAD(P)H-nitrite reductase large subunit